MQTSELTLTVRDGAALPVVLWRPDGPGPYPAVVLGVEAYGINQFAHTVATRLVDAGFVVLAPDYYRGGGPADRENYTDFAEVVRHIGQLDFTQGAHDLLTVIEHVRELGFVDATRLAVWGYCTGATLALLAAELSDRLAAAVLFFPSQPRFAELAAKTPVHPVDLLWALRCPVLFVYGDRDGVMPPDLLADLEQRLTTWSVPHTVSIQPGAGHSFTAPVPPMRNAAADAASWAQALEFLTSQLA